MVRRHRLQEEEMGYVMKSVHLRLVRLARRKEYTEETETLFRVLWRLTRHSRGAPGYPETNEDEVKRLLRDTWDLRKL